MKVIAVDSTDMGNEMEQEYDCWLFRLFAPLRAIDDNLLSRPEHIILSKGLSFMLEYFTETFTVTAIS